MSLPNCNTHSLPEPESATVANLTSISFHEAVWREHEAKDVASNDVQSMKAIKFRMPVTEILGRSVK